MLSLIHYGVSLLKSQRATVTLTQCNSFILTARNASTTKKAVTQKNTVDVKKPITPPTKPQKV